MTPGPVATQENSDINLTPMLDVVFILLIFFVVSATFIREVGVPVDAPPSLTSPPDEIESITVTVGPASSFSVNGSVLAGASLAPYIRQLRVESPDAGFAVVVLPDSRVKDATRAIDAGRQAGFGIVPIVSTP